MSLNLQDEHWMGLALEQAQKAQQLGEVPVGAVLVANNEIIATSYNKPISSNNATAHAEIELIKIAGAKLQNYRLINTTAYVSLEPCAMCFGAIIHARISRLVFAAYDGKTGVCGSCADFRELNCFNHKLQITGGVLADRSAQLLQNFFKNKR